MEASLPTIQRSIVGMEASIPTIQRSIVGVEPSLPTIQRSIVGVEAPFPRTGASSWAWRPPCTLPRAPVFCSPQLMATAPRTIQPDEPFEDIEAFLDHLHLHLLACELTKPLAPPIGQLVVDLAALRASRAALMRAILALKAREIFTDDDLDRVLDEVKAALAADKSEAGVAFYKDVFEGKSPSEVRKFVLGPQLTTMTFWPGKLSGSADPEVQELGTRAKQVTDGATQLVNDIGAAEAALVQFDLGPRAAFAESCNAATKLVFGKLSELEHNPPNGPLPTGFVDRFILREGGGRAASIKEMEAIVDRTKAKLARQEKALKELKSSRAKGRKAKLRTALNDKAAKAALAAEAAAKEAAELAALQAELDKEPDEDE